MQPARSEHLHSVKLDDADPLQMQPGESVSQIFAAAATYDCVCSLHATDWQGRVVVTED